MDVVKTTVSVRLDDKGRLTLPRSVREAIHAEPGDVFYVETDGDGILRLVRAVNPFDVLAEQALREDDAGETISLNDVLRREGISLGE
jgi:AbrB family looped-hinge helix DNA binding protein